MESCRFVVLGCCGGRLGSVLDTGSRLHRMCRALPSVQMQIKTGKNCWISSTTKMPQVFDQESALESPKNRRRRPTQLPDPRPIRRECASRSASEKVNNLDPMAPVP